MFVRVSYMQPKDGQEDSLTDILKRLSVFYREQPGYLGGYVLSPYPGAIGDGRRFGRVGTWETQDAAEDAAQHGHALALRSELARIVEEDSHFEYSYTGEPDNL